MSLEYLPVRHQHQITIDGYAVPHIEAREHEKTQTTHVLLDGRFGLEIPADRASEILWFIANAIAIGAGYSCHGENSQIPNPFKVRVIEIETRSADDERH